MFISGWFKLHRKIFINGIWDNIHLNRLFIYLISQAVFSEEGVWKGDIHVKRGQLLKSYRNIREDLVYIENNSEKRYSLSNIKGMVDHLNREQMIETKTTKLGTLFIILNYAKYQDLEQEKDKEIEKLRTEKEQLKNKLRTVKEQCENNNKKDNKDNEEIKDLNNSCSNSENNNSITEKVGIKFGENSMPFKAARYLRKLILENNPRQPVPENKLEKLQDWALELDRLNRLGPPGGSKGYDWNEIGDIMIWCQQDNFWQGNILSASKFRKQITKLENKMKTDNSNWHKQDKQDETVRSLLQKYKEEEEEE